MLGAALARAGHVVAAATAVSDASRARVAELLPQARIEAAPEVVAASDLALLAVPDDQLPDLVGGLAAAGAFHPGQIVVHTSAPLGHGALEAAAPADVLPVALHPACALTGRPSDLDRLVGTVFAVTTLRTLRPLGEALVLEMGGEPVWVEEEDRPAYSAALAAVHDSVTGVLSAAARVLGDCGIPHPVRSLGPLVVSTYEQVLRTGSLAREPAGDAAPGTTDPEEHP